MSGSGKIVMCGCAGIGAYILDRLVAAQVEVSHLVTLSPEQSVKYHVSGYQDLRPIADKHGIPHTIASTYSLSSDQDVQFFKDKGFDLIIQGGWQRLFPQKILDTLGIGAVGAHGSSDALPKGRGRSPLNWSLIQDKKRFLLHLFLIQAGVDDGDVFDVEDFDINPFDDIETLYLKVSLLKSRMLIKNIPKLIAGDIVVREQYGVPSYYAKRSPDDGAIDWEEMDVHDIYNLTRALTRPYPGAFGLIDGTQATIWRARVFDTRITYPDARYGDVVERFETRILINCRGGLLLIDEYERR